ncbi:biotin--[acetyl-CoA-carboxylase] ligase [Nioella nitratireducens]|uniref:biotin--[acetyl-CoA-carboxylase] ligase n=1 Tax=Nioella nitratireducens TaxID=1287720 RepID=UPI0008FD68E8|nr:biotin--[acetyl-CoA-carboxylase] ligase [Nioella nitratireducens]
MFDWPQGVGRRVLASVDSTMAEGRRLAPSLAGPEWILAHEQTSGHGRRGRAWSSPKGNFFASLVMRPTESPDKVALRSFVAALALRDALVAVTGREAGLALKWPNDVLLNGGKVAGILLESLGAGQGVSHLVIGIGVNLAAAPDARLLEQGAVAPVSLQGETGMRVAPDAFLDLLAPAYARFETQFTTYGFAPIRTAWLASAARLGETITARTMAETMTGRFETIDAAGNLILQTAKGQRVIPAADIFF